jgi:L-asparagine oxygenase
MMISRSTHPEVYSGVIPTPTVGVHSDSTSGVITVTLSPLLAQNLRGALIPIDCPTSKGEHAWVTRVRTTGFGILPPDLLNVLEAVRSGALAPTAVVIKGLPSDSVSAAPLPHEVPRNRKATDLSENLLGMIGSLLGEPYGIAGEGPHLVNNLIPTKEDRQRLTGNGSELRLGIHTENAAHRWLLRDRDLSPHGLLLTGVSAPIHGPLTSVANGRRAAAELARVDYDTLRARCVELRLPIRQRVANARSTEPSPILTGHKGREVVTAAFYGDMMRPLSEGAARAVSNYEAALEASAARVAITPGVMVYIPNTYSLHARDGFTPSFDAEGRAERWLQRIFVTSRLDAFQIGTEHSDRVFELPSSE